MLFEDRNRTVAINTDYIGTADFKLSDADFDFLVETGARYTRAFLNAYAARHQEPAAKRTGYTPSH